MKNILAFTVLSLSCLFLVSCSYFDTSANAELDAGAPPTKTIDLMANGTEGQTGAKVAEVEQPINLSPPPSVEEIVRNSSGGSVDVLSLDGPVQGIATPSASQQQAYSYVDVAPQPARVYSGDPSVDVFSLDGPAYSMSEMTPSSTSNSDSLNVVNAVDGSLAVVYFDHGSTKLNASAREAVEKFSVIRDAATPISVEGHASAQSTIQDPIRRKMDNLRVSMDRALSVARALVQNGVSPNLLTTVAYGEEHPGSTQEASRRVEIRAVSGH